jgi:hypothetical protein
MKTLGWPLLLSGVFFLGYVVLRLTSPMAVDDNVLHYVLATGLISLSVVLVRALNVLLFDLVFHKRVGRQAPALLRVVVSIVTYPLLYV